MRLVEVAEIQRGRRPVAVAAHGDPLEEAATLLKQCVLGFLDAVA